MGKYDLRIVLDRPEATYVPGERITGRIEIDVHEDCECKHGLWVSCEWKASSGGLGDMGEAGKQKLFAGSWRAGEHLTYPFDLLAPPGPFTYHGKRFAIHWCISACALLGLINLAVEKRFQLVAGEPPEEAQRGQVRSTPQPYRHAVKVEGSGWRELKAVFSLAASVAALIVGVPALVLGLLEILPRFLPFSVPFPLPRIMASGGIPFAPLIIGALLTSLGWRGVKRNLRAVVAGSKLGPVELELSSDVTRPGDSITCTLRFQPRTNLDLTEATAKVIATEHVWLRDSDDHAYCEQEVVTEIPTPLSPERTLAAGEIVVLHASVTMPTDAPFSFVGGRNKLLWTVGLELKLRGWPDWTCDVPFTVRA